VRSGLGTLNSTLALEHDSACRANAASIRGAPVNGHLHLLSRQLCQLIALTGDWSSSIQRSGRSAVRSILQPIRLTSAHPTKGPYGFHLRVRNVCFGCKASQPIGVSSRRIITGESASPRSALDHGSGPLARENPVSAQRTARARLSPQGPMQSR
jgi:hypothetical protein